jgi:DNA repair exonuclease SbcCD ATPase subunit
MALRYTASDKDVTTFLEELKLLVYSFGTDYNTGTENLKVILDTALAEIDEIKLQNQEKLALLNKRKLKVDKLLNSLETLKYSQNNLEDRYIIYKEHLQQIESQSNFIYFANSYIDETISEDMKELFNLRREQHELATLIDAASQMSTYFDDMKSELEDLSSQCST